MPHKDLCEALRTCSGKHFIHNNLEGLNNMLPTPEEVSMVKAYSGDYEDLAQS